VRPFLILYAVLAVWSFATFARWASSGGERRARKAWWALVLANCLALALVWPQTGKLGLQPKFLWGWRFYPMKVHPGVLEAGAFLRRNSVAGDVLAVRGLSLRFTATDLAIQLVSLSGMPAYLAYAFAQVSDPGERRRIALERYGALREVDAAPSADEGLRRLRELGIDWYVTGAGQGPQWDPERRHAAFVEGGIAVYRTGRR
jgi:hypothetical protein